MTCVSIGFPRLLAGQGREPRLGCCVSANRVNKGSKFEIDSGAVDLLSHVPKGKHVGVLDWWRPI